MKRFSFRQGQSLELLLAIGLTAALVGMHLALLLNRGPLWRDEISSLTLASAPTMREFWSGLALDPLPALFPLVLRCWQALMGDSDFPLRILGCLIGLACLGAFWLNAKLMGRKTPILSLLLLGLCPTLIIWGDSLRAYGIGVFWIVIAFALFWRLLEQPGAKIFAATAIVAVLSVHSLYSNALIIFACGSAAALVAARRRQWERAGLALLAGAIAALTMLPYLPIWQKTAQWASLAQVDYSLGDSCRMLGIALLGPRNFLFWIWLILIAAAIPTALFLQRGRFFARSGASRRDPALYALLAAVGGFICTMMFFRAVGWGTNVWYYLPMLAIAAVAIDLVLDLGFLIGKMSLPRAASTLLGLAFTFPLALRSTDIRASNIDLVAEVISRKATPGDLVVLWPAPDGITFKRYLSRKLDWVTIPSAPNLPALPGDDVLAPYRAPDGIQPTLQRIDATLKANHRVWLASTWPLQMPEGVPPPVLPLSEANSRSLGYYLRGWGFQLAREFQTHAIQFETIDLPNEQPVSIFERSTVLVFSGWGEG